MYDKLNLSNVCKGAAEELFADQLQKVLTNIKDWFERQGLNVPIIA